MLVNHVNKIAVIKYKSCSENENMNSKSIGSVSAPRENVSKIQVMAGGAFNLSSPLEVARNRTQVYNALRNINSQTCL